MKINIAAKDGRHDIEADVDGCFAIHPDVVIGDEPCGWTLTHVPTGYAFISGISEENARKCRAELLVGKVNWKKVKRPADLTIQHIRIGRSLREKYS